MKRWLIPVLIALFCLSSCASTKLNVKEIKQIELKLEKKQKEIDKKTRVYVAGALDALTQLKLEQPEGLLALSLLSNAQSLIGVPLEAEKLSIGELIMNPKKIDILAVEDKDLLEDKVKLEDQKKEAELKLIDKAQTIVTEQHKGIVTRIKDNIIDYATIMILLIAGILIFCAFPLIYRLCSKK